MGAPSPPPRGCTRASRLGPAAPRRLHPPPRAPRCPPPPSRGAGIHHGARAPSLPSPLGSSALLPGFASFAFPRLPAPRQSDLRTQPRQRLPPRRETPPPAALRGRGGARGASRHGGAEARAPADGCRGKGPVPKGAEGLGWDLNPRPQILTGREWDVEVSTGRRSCGPEMEPLLGTRGSPTPRLLPPHPYWRGASPTGQSPKGPSPSGGLLSPPAPLSWPAEPPPLPPFGIYTFHTFVSYYPVHA